MDGKNKRWVLISCLLLAIGTSALYSSVVRHPFTYFDDQFYITNNVHLGAGLSWKVVGWSLTSTYASNWHPLTWLSHALDCELYGFNPAGHHLTNLLIHVLNVVVLFLLLLYATGALGRSLLVAALFAFHPLNVESVVWIAERKNVLSTLFLLLALGAYGRYACAPNVGRYLTLTGLFLLGLASKPMVITLPFLLLLLDFWPLQRVAEWGPPSAPTTEGKNRKTRATRPSPQTGLAFTPRPFSRLVVEKLPLLVLCAGSAVLTIIAQRNTAIRSLEVFPFDVRLENAIYAYGMYLWKAFWPTRLAVFYPHAGNTLAGWQVGAAALFLAGMSGLVWKERFRRRYLMPCWLWYLGTLVPVIGLVQVGDQAMADRYAYVPLIGIFAMVVWGVADWADDRKVNFALRVATGAAVMTALAFLTWRQIGYWRNDYELWSHALTIAPDNPLVVSNLGDTLNRMDRPEEALPFLQRATELIPVSADRHGNLAVDLVQLGRLTDAIREYEAGISLADDSTMKSHFYESLAAVYDSLEDYGKVRECYQQALKISPERTGEMIQWLTQSVIAQPSAPRYVQLGILLQASGRLPAARDAYQQALQLDPALPEAKASLDVLEHTAK